MDHPMLGPSSSQHPPSTYPPRTLCENGGVSVKPKHSGSLPKSPVLEILNTNATVSPMHRLAITSLLLQIQPHISRLDEEILRVQALLGQLLVELDETQIMWTSIKPC